MKAKPTLVQGTQDYNALQLYKRNYIFDKIKQVYQKYSFEPLETPALENLPTLTKKYGREGEQLIFKILNSGNFLSDSRMPIISQDYKTLIPQIANKGLRYDLTVPLARFIVMNHHKLHFPFRRYQIQPVWRADRPQKGRYREFYQCDVDIVGTKSLICEAEILKMIHEILSILGINRWMIRMNHRDILKAMVEQSGIVVDEELFYSTIDKLDKIGIHNVCSLLQEQGCTLESLEKLRAIFAFQGSNQERLNMLHQYIGTTDDGMQALNDCTQVLEYARLLDFDTQYITLDPTLARGLSYYTGIIVEVSVYQSVIGSIGGGGRYDYLIKNFGLPDLSGFGFSFGVDRIYDIMESQNLWNNLIIEPSTQVLVTNMDAMLEKLSLQVLSTLRAASISAAIYPAHVKLKKQLSYADKKNIPFVIIIGSEEVKLEYYTIKKMRSGEQIQCDLPTFIEQLLRSSI